MLPLRHIALLVAAFGFSTPPSSAESLQNWPNVGNDKGGMRYSKLGQINRKNVGQLQVAWTYHTGDAAKGSGSTIECTPIMINGALFVTTAKSKVVALDAGNGCERWKFDPYANFKLTEPLASGGVNRGVAYWTDGKESRIFLGAADGRLI
jgi:quinoprotein glucose dehydrogenase